MRSRSLCSIEISLLRPESSLTTDWKSGIWTSIDLVQGGVLCVVSMAMGWVEFPPSLIDKSENYGKFLSRTTQMNRVISYHTNHAFQYLYKSLTVGASFTLGFRGPQDGLDSTLRSGMVRFGQLSSNFKRRLTCSTSCLNTSAFLLRSRALQLVAIRSVLNKSSDHQIQPPVYELNRLHSCPRFLHSCSARSNGFSLQRP